MWNTKTIWQHLILNGVIVFCIIVVISFYVELLGNRILYPKLSFADMWNGSNLSGSIRTSLAAIFLGVLFVIAGLIPRKTRYWTKSHFFQLGFAGVALFLLFITALILWFPT